MLRLLCHLLFQLRLFGLLHNCIIWEIQCIYDFLKKIYYYYLWPTINGRLEDAAIINIVPGEELSLREWILQSEHDHGADKEGRLGSVSPASVWVIKCQR